MFKNYFRTAFRNLVKNKAYSLINITGLAVGLASFIIILLYMNYELSYDTWAYSLSRVYKVSEQTDEDILQRTAAPLGNLLRQNAPQIEAATTMQPAGDFELLISAGDKKIYQAGSVVADSSFFRVFPYRFIRGNAATALDKPDAIVLTSELAEKLFGSTDVVGKTIKLFNTVDLEITGIISQPDKPSHLNVQFVYRDRWFKENMFWENYSYLTYVKTKQVVPDGKLEQDINRIYYDSRLKKKNETLQAFRKAGHQAGLFVDEVKNIHNFPKHGNSNFTTVSVLLLLALLLLIAGAINFSNLSIAASVKRAKEVGVRKVLGSNKKQLLIQFLGEIALQCSISLLIALLIAKIALPYFNSAFNVHIRFFHPENIISIVAQIAFCLLSVIILSGLYPAVFLTRYNITKVLKGDYSTGTRGMIFRNALIVVQFTVSAFFIIGTFIISSQMHYMQTKGKGFSGEQVMRIQAQQQKTRDAGFETVQNVLRRIPGVQYVSKTTKVPGDASLDTSTIAYKYNGREYRMGSVKVSTDYFQTLNIALAQGRLFDNRYEDQHTRTAIINEAAAQKLSLKNPVGAIITFPYCDTVPVQIAGVVKDFNVSGFENAVQPVVFTIGSQACRFQSGGAILVKLTGAHMQQSVADIEKAWKSIEPDFPIRYSFLDDNFQKFFTSYIHLRQIINFFGIIAIIISVTGLFALTIFLVNQRTKEIGIRKILGAGVNDLSLLLSRDFIGLIIIAVAIATPLGWWAASRWLQNFAYRVEINGWIFLAAALIVISISIIVIGAQTMKAALANPAKSLRTEG